MFIPYFFQKFTIQPIPIRDTSYQLEIFDFIFTNWRLHKSHLILSTPTKNKFAEQPTKKIIPEINITQ